MLEFISYHILLYISIKPKINRKKVMIRNTIALYAMSIFEYVYFASLLRCWNVTLLVSA